MGHSGLPSWLLGGGKPQTNNRFQILPLLSEIKESIPTAVAKQLRNTSIMNMFAADHIPDELSCITFAQGLGLAPTRDSEVSHCAGGLCKSHADKDKRLGFVYICRNKRRKRKVRCLTKISPLINTFFEGSRLTMRDILSIIMCFVLHITVKQVVLITGLSERTVIDWYVFCREICEVIIANEFEGKIGGEGMIVEVDESHLFRRKYGMGRKGKCEDKWLLGCYCRDTKQCKIVQVPDRKRSTIMPLLLQIVDTRSTIITDFAKIYKGCEKFGFKAHKSVCHKRYFVCPNDSETYTNNIEITWRWRKRDVLSCGDDDSIDRYLAESEYRRRYFNNIDMVPVPLDDQFLLFCYHIKLVYPGPGKVGLTFPIIEEEGKEEEKKEEKEEEIVSDVVVFDDSDNKPPCKKSPPCISTPLSVPEPLPTYICRLR